MSAVMCDHQVELLAILHAIDPNACERAKRVKFAMEQLRLGTSRRVISGEIKRRFNVSQPTAWIVVDMAYDMAGPL